MLRYLRKKTKVILWIVIIAFVGTIFFVWGMKNYQSDLEPVIASIDDIEISPKEFNTLYQQYIEFYRNIYKNNFSPSLIPNLEKNIVRRLIRSQILLREAYKQNIKVSNQEIIEEIKKSFVDKEGNFDINLYNQYVKNTPSQFWQAHELRIKNSLMTQKLENIFKDQIKISKKELFDYYLREYSKAELYHILIDPQKCIPEKKIKEYYRKNKEDFLKPQEIRASHILIKLSPKASRIESRKAKKKIEEILKKIKEGEDFSKLAKKFSECPSKDKGGDLGYFRRGVMVKEFEEVAFKLKVNQVSEIIKTKFGYHIIKLTDRKEKEYKSISEVRDEILKALSKEGEDEAYKKSLSLWKRLKKKERFKDLALKYSHAPSGKEGGYLGIIPYNLNYSPLKPDKISQLKKEIIKDFQIDPQFKKAAFSLKEGSISEVIKSSKGYHIIMLKKLILPSMKDFEKEKENIRLHFLMEKKNNFFDNWYEEVKSNYKVVVNSRFK